MAFSAMKERYRNKINEVVLGATKEEGGTVVTPLLSAVKVRCHHILKVKSQPSHRSFRGVGCCTNRLA